MFVGNSKQLFFPAWKAQSKLPMCPKCDIEVAYGRGSHTADAAVVYGRCSHVVSSMAEAAPSLVSISPLHCHRRRLPKDPRRRRLPRHCRPFPLRLPPAHPLIAWLWILL